MSKFSILLLLCCSKLNISETNSKNHINLYPKEAVELVQVFNSFYSAGATKEAAPSEYTQLITVFRKHRKNLPASAALHFCVEAKYYSMLKILILCGYDTSFKYEGMTLDQKAESLKDEKAIEIINESKKAEKSKTYKPRKFLKVPTNKTSYMIERDEIQERLEELKISYSQDKKRS